MAAKRTKPTTCTICKHPTSKGIHDAYETLVHDVADDKCPLNEREDPETGDSYYCDGTTQVRCEIEDHVYWMECLKCKRGHAWEDEAGMEDED